MQAEFIDIKAARYPIVLGDGEAGAVRGKAAYLRLRSVRIVTDKLQSNLRVLIRNIKYEHYTKGEALCI